MSQTSNSTPSRASSIFMGTLAAFASFAVIAAIIQGWFGGKPDDAAAADRLKKREDVVAEQSALLQKYGLTDKADATIAKAADQIKSRKMEPSGVVVPGSPTAAKLNPAPAPAPGAKPAANPTPAPSPAPAPAAGANQAPAPAPTTPPAK